MDTKALRQKILDLAIRGKLVPQDPNDEPASVLLERIREEKERLIKEGKIKRSKKNATTDTPQYQHVPFEIPDSWEWVKLEDIAYVASGSTPSKECFVPIGVPYLKMYNLRNQKIDFDYQPQYILKETHEGKLARSKCVPGDLIMNIVGPPLGKLAIIPDSLPECNFNQAAVLIRAYLNTRSTNLYLRYFLWEMSAINSITTRGNAGQDNISLTQCQNLLVPLPPLTEQKKIIETIDRLFYSIEEIENHQSDLRDIIAQTKSKILSLAIQGKLVDQDPSDEPAAEMMKRINPAWQPCDTSHYENIPQGWCISTLDFIGDSELGKTLDREKNRGNLQPYLCSLNVLWDDFNLQTIKEMRIETNEYERYRIKKGDLLICEGGEVGRTAIWNNNEDIFYQNSLHRVRFTDGLNPYYFMYLFTYLKQIGIIDAYSKGMTIKHFTKTSLRSLPLIIPPINEQKRIVEKIKNLFTLLDEIIRQLK